MLCHVFIKLQRTGLNPAGFQQRFDLEHVGIQYRWTAHRHRKNFLSQFSDCPSLSIWRAQTGASAVRPASPLHSWLTTEISKVSKNVVRTVKSVQTWHTHGKQFAVSICWNNFEETENSRKKKKKKQKSRSCSLRVIRKPLCSARFLATICTSHQQLESCRKKVLIPGAAEAQCSHLSRLLRTKPQVTTHKAQDHAFWKKNTRADSLLFGFWISRIPANSEGIKRSRRVQISFLSPHTGPRRTQSW